MTDLGVPNRGKNLRDYGFVRVAVTAPKGRVADTVYNSQKIADSCRTAYRNGARIIVTPELGITLYTAMDLFHQKRLRSGALDGLRYIIDHTFDLEALIVVGLPLIVGPRLYNVAAVLNGKKIIGIVPKSCIPNYKEFQERRWFSSARTLNVTEIELLGQTVPIGTDLLFRHSAMPECILAVEICEDLWGPVQPSGFHAIAGATVIANPSASNELVGKAAYRRSLVEGQAARCVCAYAYASCGPDESTDDVVFGRHSIIAVNGENHAETKRFSRESETAYADVDIDGLVLDRIRTTSFSESIENFAPMKYRTVEAKIAETSADTLMRKVAQDPFVPSDPNQLAAAAEDVILIQSASLAKRLEHTGIKKVVLGLSGGVDSTLALLVALRTMSLLGLPAENIHCFTMPGLATTERTRSNAWKLAQASGASIEEIPIGETVALHFRDISHDGKTEDITYENAQARYRKMILLDKANQLGAIDLGTGNLTELASGNSTFNGDHISQYNVNGGVPKTLSLHVIRHEADTCAKPDLKDVLYDILATPISAELKSDQSTEDFIGPQILWSFFIYHFVRWHESPSKILWLAEHAYRGVYDSATLTKWLRLFVVRFFRQQWKRAVMSNGPKVGSVSLSPRGDWRMPSDAEIDLWMADLPGAEEVAKA